MPALHDFECQECDFVSVGHRTKKARDARGQQHLTEHESGQQTEESRRGDRARVCLTGPATHQQRHDRGDHGYAQ